MVTVDVFNAHPDRKVRAAEAGRYVRKALRVLGVDRARVSVVFVDSRHSRTMNRWYLRHDYSTDVLSFTLERAPLLEGEIYVNLDRARRQAREYGVSMNNEVARLVIHGTLHLVGFDDSTARKARRMKAEEDRQLRYWFH